MLLGSNCESSVERILCQRAENREKVVSVVQGCAKKGVKLLFG